MRGLTDEALALLITFSPNLAHTNHAVERLDLGITCQATDAYLARTDGGQEKPSEAA